MDKWIKLHKELDDALNSMSNNDWLNFKNKMEKKDNSGALFTNDKREKETHPHYQGKATINGVEYYVSSWVKEGQKGKYQSLSFKPVQQQVKPAGKPTYGNKEFDDFLNNL